MTLSETLTRPCRIGRSDNVLLLEPLRMFRVVGNRLVEVDFERMKR